MNKTIQSQLAIFTADNKWEKLPRDANILFQ